MPFPARGMLCRGLAWGAEVALHLKRAEYPNELRELIARERTLTDIRQELISRWADLAVLPIADPEREPRMFDAEDRLRAVRIELVENRTRQAALHRAARQAKAERRAERGRV